MTRFTSIGMGKKTFVASAKEEQTQSVDKSEEPTAGPSNPRGSKDKKRPRDRDQDNKPKREGWSRDDDLASKHPSACSDTMEVR